MQATFFSQSYGLGYKGGGFIKAVDGQYLSTESIYVEVSGNEDPILLG